MNIEQARFNMIEQQIRPWDVLDTDVLELLTIVKREAFVPAAYRGLAFADSEIPLPGGENMLAPRVEARIMQELTVQKHETVLEIGAGSGYMAALLAHKARHVTTVEINPELKALAEKNLADYGVTNVEVVEGDAAQGYTGLVQPHSPYDVIVVSGSLPFVPEALLAQLKVGGRMFAVVGTAPAMTAQIITRISEVKFDTVGVFETLIKPLQNAPAPSQFKF
ncbi:MAG: protein-L-isoaspartate O-methyltransferase [Oxalicibacterium faecigallinarum]|uniref:Protein-L-isoaspartate O-methyltransferase n=1 Tax=Oxalicibacterium faecigallinarum TaxID=573741 RepID=A0A8J3AZ66_9BURK|nr:protein-L-isoaspartate O-methyltransferase [Oxalicibacterium faecigallinarum]MDQ7968032.1 protein-L-isoaspartate O-methyltransferase [Oxalicibacterium faecigallinarum]GGI20316.1 protein-L-isoaspartate O-methyltransferase [Oxalicibacterium faecigallinarum]